VTRHTKKYPRDQAVSLIYACYKELGSLITKDSLEESCLERELGRMPETWNVGLFRFLDEALYLVSNIQTLALANMLENCTASQAVLLHQIEKNALAVRILLASGLDGPARQNIRALYEMCHAFCRFQIDADFRNEFCKQSDFEAANSFWHKYISRQKTEAFLQEFNETSEHKCLLVGGGLWNSAHKILGVGAHPNYLGWLFDFGGHVRDLKDTEHSSDTNPERATEFALTTCCHLLFLTLNFSAKFVSQSLINEKVTLKSTDIFQHHEHESEAIKSVGSIALLMFAMMIKLTNRNRPDFDESIHF